VISSGVDVGVITSQRQDAHWCAFPLFFTQIYFTSGKFSAYDDAISEPGPNLPVDGSENMLPADQGHEPDSAATTAIPADNQMVGHDSSMQQPCSLDY
jgi:hypothetical protein